ncbi:hypothetical protein TCE0_041r13789 [Talaromyces pinophilus]|jgi:hypothetical protein|uniref:Uncharacterized protein n=1 Tax=Talaromyces pinophilus TaxID=128442 RepID=A0A6V8HJS8_TALPI|nr:hypothetical protein TCE0_041r13789 [Talaromyces pinophilus]
MEKLGEQRPQSPGYRAIDDKRLDAPDCISYTNKLTFWPKAAAGYQEPALERLKRDRESVLGSVPKPESSESQKMDANEVVLRMMVKVKLQKKELCCERYESVIETETETESESDSESESESDSESESESECECESESDSESESGSESESDSDSDSDSYSHSYSDGDWEWVHYYDFELYPGD